MPLLANEVGITLLATHIRNMGLKLDIIEARPHFCTENTISGRRSSGSLPIDINN